jgi:TolA-binding protein
MRIKTLLSLCFIILLTPCSPTLFAQGETLSDKQFEIALRDFVNENLVEFGMDVISQERFLVEQMRLLNFEIQARYKNLSQMRNEYFANLQLRLEEVRTLKSRMGDGGSPTLVAFIDQLEIRIEQTIDEGRVNYRRQKVFEDGLQLLYIAEEMGHLDAGTRFEGDQQIAQQLVNSQQKLQTSFGDREDFMSRMGSASDATIFDLFQEWKLTNTMAYEARWTDVQIIKNKLIRNGTAVEKDRMFKEELRSAVMAYNYRSFDLADRTFGEMINRYSYLSTLDDLYYYRGLSNYQLGRYEIASEIFLKQVELDPTSQYTAPAYSSLIKIASHVEDHQNVANYFQQYQKYATGADADYDENRFTVARSFILLNQYENAVNILSEIPGSSEFYIDGQYLLAQAYVGAENLDDAVRVLRGIIDNHNLDPQYHFLIKMKLGYLMYEKEDYARAINYFNDIGNNFSMYDRVLIGYAWTYYKRELQKPEGQPKDFSYAKKNLEVLLSEYYASDYVLEAKSLVGYILQVEEDADNAIKEFDDVFRARFTKDRSDKNLADREKIKSQMADTKQDRNKALASFDQNDFKIAQSRYSTLQDSMLTLSYSDLSASSSAAYNEIRQIQTQIDELERLKGVARQKNDENMIIRIEELQAKLKDSISDNFPEQPDPRLGVNQFDESPIARKESVRDHQKMQVLAMRDEVLSERNYIKTKLDEITISVDRARQRKDYKDLVQLEIQQEKFQNLLKKFDQLNTYVYDLPVDDSQVDFQKWTDYGAFGVADVNYSVKQNKIQRRSYYVDQVSKINQILNGRKDLLEHKINLIDGEVSYMTRRVREQERLRERAELDRKFEESYFDTHTSEFEENQEQPPIIEEDENQNP